MRIAGGPWLGLPAALVAVVTALLAGSAAATSSAAPAPLLSPELRADVARLVAGEGDRRLERLLPGYRPGELGYFVVLETKTAADRVAIERAGARVLREYTTIDAFAVASTPRSLRRVARLPHVARLAPIEVLETEAEQEVDQTRATTADVGATALWDQGITGEGIRIPSSTPVPMSPIPIWTISTFAAGRGC
jgi:hypothetical protein